MKWPITSTTTVMVLATAAFRRMVMGWVHLPPVLAVLVFVPFGAAVYFATMYWQSRPLLMELISLARAGLGIFGRSKVRAASEAS